MQQLHLHSMRRSLITMRKYLDQAINRLTADLKLSNHVKGFNRIICDNCKTLNVRVRMDKTYHCRSCGYDTRKRRD